MASNPPGECCTVMVRHEGEPTGELAQIDGIDVYIATPSSKTAKSNKAIILLTDVNGIYTNPQLIADQLAENGYYVIIPDFLHGDPYSSGTSLEEWLAKHGTAVTDPIVDKMVKGLKEKGYEKIGGIGYCFGARFVVRFLKEGQINAGFLGHPSFVQEKELEEIQGPLSIAAAEIDSIFTVDKRHKSEEILSKVGMPYQINLYSQAQHGFAVRGDLTVPAVKFANEQAFVQARTWFDNWL